LLISINDVTFYNFIRQTATSNGWGDIYTLNNLYYNIQIKGNALLPVAFMVTFLNNIDIKRILLIRLLLLIAVFFSGNFAYLVAISIFLLFFSIYRINTFFKLYKWGMYLTLFFLMSSFPIYKYINNTLTEKKDDSIYERYQQSELLLNELKKNPITFLMGLGQGATLDKSTSTRDYKDLTYFELQIIYFFYQLGLIMFFIFLFLYFYLAFISFTDKYLILIYSCYIIYSLTNPYIFDTNNIIVIILLNSLQFKYPKNNKYSNHLILE